MQKIITFVLLCTLSFSIVHDSFISLLDNKTHASISHLSTQLAQDKSCTTFNELHNMFHFMAILSSFSSFSPYFSKNTILPIFVTQTVSPLQESAYKPPIV